jgi:hypothetical protein
MKVTVELDITGCVDCPFSHQMREHGGSFTYCVRRDDSDGYGAIIKWTIEDGLITPDWCPLGVKQ